MNKQYENFIKIINTGLTGKIHTLENPDYELLIHLSYEQNIVPIFLEGLVKYNYSDKISVASKIRMFEVASSYVASQTQRTTEFCDVYKKLTDAGIKPVILKGLICRIAYGKNENHRCSGDEDIYINKEDFFVCKKILEENGYYTNNSAEITEKLLSGIHTVNFKSDRSPLIIEVHLNFIGNQNNTQKKMDSVFENISDKIISIEYCSEKYYTLSYTYHFIYLYFHYIKHFTSSGAGLRHVMDLAVFGEAYKDKIDFDLAYNEISKCVKASFLADTSEIINLLGFDRKTPFKAKKPELLCEDLLNGGTFGFNNPENFYANTFISLKGRNARFPLLRAVFPSYAIMASVYPQLYNKPILLPVFYIKRIIRYFSKKRNKQLEKNMTKSGKDRIKLIKSYMADKER